MHTRKLTLFASLIVVALAGWWGYYSVHPAAAQDGALDWSEPKLLSNPEYSAGPPAIVADMAGNIHIIWAETPVDESQAGEGEALFYTRWDGTEWTAPIDVLVSPQGSTSGPELAITPDGMLHATWFGSQKSEILHARAPACCADDPRNWSQPESLGSQVLLSTAMVADDEGRLHVVYPTVDRAIIYRQSSDSGVTWPVWSEIPSGLRLDDEQPVYPRLTVDGKGRIHVVWTVIPLPGRAVMYSRSDDGGMTWREPEIIDTSARADYDDGYGPMLIDIEAVGDDEIHMIWDGAPTIERTHLWSSNGGETWSSMYNQIFPTVTGNGRSGWNDMQLDSAGNLHAISIHGNSNALHAVWNGTSWSAPEEIPTMGAAEFPRITITEGNLLHFVWSDKKTQIFTNWYVKRQLPAPKTSGVPLPTVEPSPTPTMIVVEHPVSTPTPQPTQTPVVRDWPQDTADMTQTNPGFSILLSIMPAIAIVGLVAIARFISQIH